MINNKEDSTELFEALFNQTAVGIAQLSPQGFFLQANNKFCDILGYNNDEFKKMSWQNITYPEDIEKGAELVRKLQDGKISDFTQEKRYIRKDGSIVWGKVTISQVTDESDKPKFTISILEDIQQRKSTEQQREELAHLMDLNVNEVYIIDKDTFLFTYANETAQRSTGYNLEKLYKMVPSDFVNQSKEELREKFRQLVDKEVNEIPFIYTEHRRADGTVYPIQAHLQMVEYDGRHQILSVVINATQEIQAKIELIKQKTQLENAQRIAHIGSWEWDIEQGSIEWSDEVYKIFGLEPQDLSPTYERFLEFVHPDDRNAVHSAVNNSLEEKIPYSIEHRIIDNNGLKKIVHEEGEANYDTNGKPLKMVGTVNDMTEMKQAERRLRHSLVQTIETLSRAYEKRDPYTTGHQGRVAQIAVEIGKKLNFEKHRLEGLRLGGLIHDIGKISVPADLLTKPTKLTPLEYQLIQTHAEQGYEIVKDIDFPWPLKEMIRLHHERLDGSGYPLGLKGDAIPIEAKILCVADVVEAMTTHRPYRPGLGLDEALKEITNNSGRLYDKQVVDGCLEIFNTDKFVIPEP